MLTIRQIYQEDYPGGKKVSYQYSSEKYYEVGVDRKDDGYFNVIILAPSEELLDDISGHWCDSFRSHHL